MDFTPHMAAKLIKSVTGIILEIGANDGLDTRQFLSAFPSSEIHCFEPDPRAIGRWRKNVRDLRAHLHEFALSDTAGTRTLYQSAGRPPDPRWESYGEWDKSGSILPFDRHRDNAPWMETDRTIQVPTMTLDQWAVAHPQTVDFLWIDVQGAEAMVLGHGQTTLKRTRFVYAECDPRPNYHNQATLADLDNVLQGFTRQNQYDGYNWLFRNEAMS